MACEWERAKLRVDTSTGRASPAARKRRASETEAGTDSSSSSPTPNLHPPETYRIVSHRRPSNGAIQLPGNLVNTPYPTPSRANNPAPPTTPE